MKHDKMEIFSLVCLFVSLLQTDCDLHPDFYIFFSRFIYHINLIHRERERRRERNGNSYKTIYGMKKKSMCVCVCVIVNELYYFCHQSLNNRLIDINQ